MVAFFPLCNHHSFLMEHARDEPLKGVGDLVGKIGARRENWGQAAASCENWMADPTSAPEIDRAAENFLRAPAEVLDLIGEKLTALKRQRDHLQAELKAGKAAEEPTGTDQIEALVGRLWRLGEEMEQAEPARRREVFRLMVSRIDLRFDKVQRGKRTECPLRSGEIHLRTDADGIFGSVNRGDKTPLELFLAGIRGWDGGLRHQVNDGTFLEMKLPLRDTGIHSPAPCSTLWRRDRCAQERTARWSSGSASEDNEKFANFAQNFGAGQLRHGAKILVAKPVNAGKIHGVPFSWKPNTPCAAGVRLFVVQSNYRSW